MMNVSHRAFKVEKPMWSLIVPGWSFYAGQTALRRVVYAAKESLANLDRSPRCVVPVAMNDHVAVSMIGS